MENSINQLCPLPNLPRKTRVMGIVNVTPDSFSDGGQYYDSQHALDHANKLIEEGADILDIGGESTRPGAHPVNTTEELRRVIPLIENIRSHNTIPISIDTTKSEVARQALQAGATIINDISAMHNDAQMVEVAREAGAWLILMHMRGTPTTMQNNPSYDQVGREVAAFLTQRAEQAIQHGILQERIILDPGIGFGKAVHHNIELLQAQEIFSLPYPVLIGCSRKTFIGTLLDQPEPETRLLGSLACAAAAVTNGASIIRVHDVRQTIDFFSLFDAINSQTTASRRELTNVS